MSTQVASAMPPPAARPAAGVKRKREVVTLDEDEWTSRIEAIIQRDYYPDLPKLQNKLEWLQAVRSGNPMQLQQAQQNIAQRRAGIKTPVGATPAAFGTPGASLLRTPGLGATPTFGTPGMTPGLRINADGQVVPTGPQDPTLDKFFAQHNSEDNKSFNELMQVSRARLRKAKPWLFKDYNPPQQTARLEAQPQQALLAANQSSAAAPGSAIDASGQPVVQHSDTTVQSQALTITSAATAASAAPLADTAANRPASDTDGFGTTGQPSSTLLSWPHTNKSALYYDSSQRDVVPWTEAELNDMVQGPPKQIKHSATRFATDPNEAQDQANGSEQLGVNAQLPGIVRGYGVLNTPAFTPGPDQSPLMTWGDIGSTPIRLDEEDDIHVHASAGSAFKMADVPVREQLGRGAAQKATLSLRRKSAARQGTPLAALRAGQTPGKGKAPGTPLSAAGRKLLSNLRGGTPSGNAQLRASYTTQTPGRLARHLNSPALSGWGTPVLERTPRASSRHVAPGSAQHTKDKPMEDAAVDASASLTDDLLKL